jgi:hypothetical protein
MKKQPIAFAFTIVTGLVGRMLGDDVVLTITAEAQASETALHLYGSNTGEKKALHGASGSIVGRLYCGIKKKHGWPVSVTAEVELGMWFRCGR